MIDNRESSPKAWAEHYWTSTLTHKGREKALLTLGRAAGFQFADWHELPPDLKRALRRLWGNKPQWVTEK
jgi:hypothetical protein